MNALTRPCIGAQLAMWETTFPRLTHTGLDQDLPTRHCILGSMVSSLTGLSNPAWVSLGNVVSLMAKLPGQLVALRAC